MDKMQAQIADLETWRGSAQKQLNKLFSGLNNVEQMVQGHIASTEANNLEIQEKLDKILAHQDAADERDDDHDKKIQAAAADREDLRKAVNQMVKQEMKDKGLPSSGKQLYGCVGVAGAIGSALMTVFLAVLPHLNELGDFILKVWKGVQV